jgi:hypothetical protein
MAYETKGIDYMENWSNTLRRDESRVAGGNTRLFELYNVLLAIDCRCRDGYRRNFSFEDRKTRLDTWLNAYPQSVTANLAMSGLWEYRSWQVVNGNADLDVATPEQREEFQRDRRTAWSQIKSLKVTDDPYVAFFKLRIRRHSDATQDEMTRMFEESVATWPQHSQVYRLYAGLLPWILDRDRSQVRLMEDLAAAKEDPDRQVGLAYIVGSTFRQIRFKAWDITWADVKHAYEVRRGRYGWRNRDLNTFCFLAIQAKDWPTARDCMQEINGHWDDVVWHSQNDFVLHELMASLF